MIVRLEAPDDHDAGLGVERLAFSNGQGGEPADDIAWIVRELRGRDEAWALVAEDDGVVVGHVQLSRGWVGDDPVVVLGPIGVRPDRMGRGIGSALVRASLDEARARGEVAIVLLGDPRFYGRFGFVPGATLGLRNPSVGVQPDGFVIREEDFQVAPLDDRADKLSGPVRWDPALDG